MDLAALRDFFMWCTIINGGLLVASALFTSVARGWIYRIHGRLYDIPRESFNVTICRMIGVYKVLVITFNVIPFVALAIIGA